jgi:hypothetical protein
LAGFCPEPANNEALEAETAYGKVEGINHVPWAAEAVQAFDELEDLLSKGQGSCHRLPATTLENLPKVNSVGNFQG